MAGQCDSKPSGSLCINVPASIVVCESAKRNAHCPQRSIRGQHLVQRSDTVLQQIAALNLQVQQCGQRADFENVIRCSSSIVLGLALQKHFQVSVGPDFSQFNWSAWDTKECELRSTSWLGPKRTSSSFAAKKVNVQRVQSTKLFCQSSLHASHGSARTGRSNLMPSI